MCIGFQKLMLLCKCALSLLEQRQLLVEVRIVSVVAIASYFLLFYAAKYRKCLTS